MTVNTLITLITDYSVMIYMRPHLPSPTSWRLPLLSLLSPGTTPQATRFHRQKCGMVLRWTFRTILPTTLSMPASMMQIMHCTRQNSGSTSVKLEVNKSSQRNSHGRFIESPWLFCCILGSIGNAYIAGLFDDILSLFR